MMRLFLFTHRVFIYVLRVTFWNCVSLFFFCLNFGFWLCNEQNTQRSDTSVFDWIFSIYLSLSLFIYYCINFINWSPQSTHYEQQYYLISFYLLPLTRLHSSISMKIHSHMEFGTGWCMCVCILWNHDDFMDTKICPQSDFCSKIIEDDVNKKTHVSIIHTNVYKSKIVQI